MNWEEMRQHWRAVGKAEAKLAFPYLSDADLEAVAGDQAKLDAAIHRHTRCGPQAARQQTIALAERLEAPNVKQQVETTQAKEA